MSGRARPGGRKWIPWLVAGLAACGSGTPAGPDALDGGLEFADTSSPDTLDIEDVHADEGAIGLDMDPGGGDGGGADPIEPDVGFDDSPTPSSGFQVVDLQSVGHVRAMWASPEAGFWAVGDGGLVLRSQGADVVPAPLPPTTADLLGVSGEGRTVVAVGRAGTVLRWEDGRWSLLDAPTGQSPAPDLYGVGVISGEDFYVSGQKGSLFHFQDGAWTAEATGITYDLFGVHASRAGGVFAVGAFGTLIELRGGHWIQSQIALPTATLRSLWRAADGRMFAVGSGGAVSMFDGLTWKIQITNDPSEPPRDLHAVTGFSGDEVYAAGDRGAILKYNGKKWTLMTIAGPYNVDADLRGLAGVLNADGSRTLLAVGLDSRAVRLEDKVWQDMTLGVTGDLNAVAVREDGSILAAGDRGLLLVFRDGRLATIESGTANDLRGVGGRIAAGTGGTILRIEGDIATGVGSPVADDWNDVWEVAGVALLAGEGGTLLRLDASGIQVIPARMGAPLKAVCVAGGAVFVAGDAGRMFVDEGAGFHPVATRTFSTLWDLRPAVGRAVLAVGDHGVILSCDPMSCRRIHEDPTTFLYGLGRVHNGLALAVGWAGAVKWIGDGEQVMTLDPGTFRVFRAAAGLGPAGETFLVGPGGTFYVYRP